MKYKGIKHNILNDAPFIGALIIANQCSMPCKDCLNEHLKDNKYTKENSADEIIKEVLNNNLNQGVILSGLEWTEQPMDLISIIEESIKNELKVILYTHHNEIELFELIPALKKYPIFIKFGLYNENKINSNYYSKGVKLATTNQYIKKFKGN